MIFRYKTIVYCAIFVLASGVGIAQGPSSAERLSSCLPDGTIGFLAFSGGEQLGSALFGSSLGQFRHYSGLGSFCMGIRNMLITETQKKITQSEKARSSGFSTLLAQLMAYASGCPTVIAIVENPAGNSLSMPYGLLVVVEAGKWKDKMQENIWYLEDIAGHDQIVAWTNGGFAFRTLRESGNTPIIWGWDRDTLVLMINYTSAEWLKGFRSPNPRPSPLSGLANNGDWIAVHCECQKIGRALSGILGWIDDGDPYGRAINFVDALVLQNLQSVTIRAGFARKDLIVDYRLRVPARLKGAISALKQVDRQEFDRMDARSMSAGVCRVDWALLYDGLFKNNGTGTDRQDMRNAIARLETKAGFRIRDNLLTALDGTLSVQIFPAGDNPEFPMGGLALEIGVKDAATVERQLSWLAGALTKDLSPGVVEWRTQTLEGGRAQTLMISPALATAEVVPNWVVAGNRLVLTTSPNLTTAVLKANDGENPAFHPLSGDTAFNALTSKAPSQAVYIKYSDSAIIAQQIDAQLQQVWPLIMGIGIEQGINLPMTAPDIKKQAKRLGKGLSYGYCDNDCLYGHYQGSGIEGAFFGSTAGKAVAAAILTPVMKRCQTTARRALSSANLRILGAECNGYANDNDDKFPPDLKTLITECQMNESVLVSPRKPKDYSGPSYIYIPGQIGSGSYSSILVYENPSFSDDGKYLAVLLDGHVEVMDKEQLQKSLQWTYKWLGKPMSESALIVEIKVPSD